ncbi:hypothetical protein LJC60_01040 [Ruminococcaceae bacterium OttesenSCG-928-D13]|nr:hypothetical protein [Ruminococcaceae bacterium OttesenSCG-928-D13]
MSKVTRYYGNELFREGTGKQYNIYPDLPKPKTTGATSHLRMGPPCKPVVKIDSAGNIVHRFTGISAAARYEGIANSTMSQRISKGLVVGGFRWEKEK